MIDYTPSGEPPIERGPDLGTGAAGWTASDLDRIGLAITGAASTRRLVSPTDLLPSQALAGTGPVPALDSWDIWEDNISYDAAIDMQLPIAKLGGSVSRRVLLRDVRNFRTEREGTETRTYGVAIRMLISVTVADAEASLTFPIVAAQAQLGLASASARLSVLGFTDQAVGGLLPDFETIDVKSYGTYTEAADAIRRYISAHPEAVAPVLLQTVMDPDPAAEQYLDAVALAHAIRAVADRRSLDDAVRNLGGGRWEAFETELRLAYERLVPGLPSAARPSNEQADSARRWRSWL